MATYTVLISSLRPIPPQTFDEGLTWNYYIQADVIVLDSNDQPVAPWGGTEPATGFATLTAADPIVAADTQDTLREKFMDTVRPNWTPTIQSTDDLTVIWLDNAPQVEPLSI